MRPMKQTSDISAVLIEWYGRHFRPLPWRETSDPYLIWLSEVILQQTHVAQGLDYFRRFASRFPDVRSLAAATEDEVLKLWQGLGYYSRARSLHAAARRVAERFDGVFPTGYDDVRSLPGVGDYTASAVCSIAYGQPCAVVDGNVYRVLSRLTDADVPTDTAAGKRYYAERARSLLDESRPGLHDHGVRRVAVRAGEPRLRMLPVTRPLSFVGSRHGGRPSSEAGEKGGGPPLLQLSARSLRRLDAAGEADRPRYLAQSVRVSVDRDAPGGRFRRTAADGSVAGVVRRGGGCLRFGHAPDAPACAVAPCDPCLFLSGRPADLAGRIVVLSESSFVGNIPLPCLAADRALSGARGVSLPEAGEGAPALCRHVR